MSAIRAEPIVDNAERYICADIDVCPLEDNKILVYSRNNRSVHILHSDAAKSLIKCKRFGTIDAHAAELYETIYARAAPLDSIKHQLSTFAAAGLLVPYQSILEKCSSTAATSTAPSRIASIVIPSLNRLGVLERGLVSYIEHCKRYGRTNNFIIGDDSTHSDTRNACREILTSLRRRYGVEIRYADPEAKRCFVNKMANYGTIPEHVINFALFNVEAGNLTTAGANRNALLLDTVGDAILSVDDDTVCQITPAPGLEDKLTLSFGIPPEVETWFYSDQEMLLKSVAFIDTNLLALHEQVLGKSVNSCVAAFKRQTEMHVTSAKNRYVRQLESDTGRVTVTLNGIVGDCGSSGPVSLFLPEQSFKRLMQTEANYRSLRLSRQIFRFVPNTVITDRFENMMTTFFGLDNRTLVPPFLPIGRGQDGLFGYMLGKCFNTSYAARLPWSLLHAPVEARVFTPDDIVKEVGGGNLASLIRRLISMFECSGIQISGAERLRRLGKYLEEMAHLPDPEFEELARSNLWHAKRALIAQIEDRLRRVGVSAPVWTNDVKRYLAAHRQALANQETWVPDDLLCDHGVSEARTLSRRLVLRFGQLLYWWSDIVAAARDLRSQDHRLSRSVV